METTKSLNSTQSTVLENGSAGHKTQPTTEELTKRFEVASKEMLEKIERSGEDVMNWVKANPIKSMFFGAGAVLILSRLFMPRSANSKKYLN